MGRGSEISKIEGIPKIVSGFACGELGFASVQGLTSPSSASPRFRVSGLIILYLHNMTIKRFEDPEIWLVLKRNIEHVKHMKH